MITRKRLNRRCSKSRPCSSSSRGRSSCTLKAINRWNIIRLIDYFLTVRSVEESVRVEVRVHAFRHHSLLYQQSVQLINQLIDWFTLVQVHFVVSVVVSGVVEGNPPLLLVQNCEGKKAELASSSGKHDFDDQLLVGLSTPFYVISYNLCLFHAFCAHFMP